MPADIVHHIVSFLPPSDTRCLAATDTAARHTVGMWTLSPALAEQAKDVRDLDHFIALFEQISTLPPRLREQPLAELAKSTSTPPWPKSEADRAGVRRILLQACDNLPPEFRGAPLIALAGTVTFSDPEEKQQTSFNYVLDLVTDLPPHPKATVLCALINAECSSSVHNSTVFWSVTSAAKKLPRHLHDLVLQRLIAGYGDCFFPHVTTPE